MPNTGVGRDGVPAAVGPQPCAVDETVILLHPALPLVGVSIATERESVSRMTVSAMATQAPGCRERRIRLRVARHIAVADTHLQRRCAGQPWARAASRRGRGGGGGRGNREQERGSPWDGRGGKSDREPYRQRPGGAARTGLGESERCASMTRQSTACQSPPIPRSGRMARLKTSTSIPQHTWRRTRRV